MIKDLKNIKEMLEVLHCSTWGDEKIRQEAIRLLSLIIDKSEKRGKNETQ